MGLLTWLFGPPDPTDDDLARLEQESEATLLAWRREADDNRGWYQPPGYRCYFFASQISAALARKRRGETACCGGGCNSTIAAGDEIDFLTPLIVGQYLPDGTVQYEQADGGYSEEPAEPGEPGPDSGSGEAARNDGPAVGCAVAAAAAVVPEAYSAPVETYSPPPPPPPAYEAPSYSPPPPPSYDYGSSSSSGSDYSSSSSSSDYSSSSSSYDSGSSSSGGGGDW